jgi:hypothetical protein
MQPATPGRGNDASDGHMSSNGNGNGHYITKQQAAEARKRLGAVDRRLGIVATRLGNALRIKL